MTGDIALASTVLSAACGDIDQDLAAIDVSQGVILDSAVTCSVTDCRQASLTLNIDRLSVQSLAVTADGIDLVNDTPVVLDSRPAEITLAVTATFANGSSQVITSSSELVYQILPVGGQVDAIEAKLAEAWGEPRTLRVVRWPLGSWPMS